MFFVAYIDGDGAGPTNTGVILRGVFFRTPDVACRGRSARRPVSRVLSRAEARAMAIHLGRPSPGASRDRPGRPVRKPTAAVRTAARPYMVLLPEGFAVPCPSPGPRCALTAPFHPCPPASRPGRAVCSLWHFPWGRPRRALPGSVLPWSPDFPPPREGGGGHPAVWRTLVTRRWRRGQGFPRDGGRRRCPRPRTVPAALSRRGKWRAPCAGHGSAGARRSPSIRRIAEASALAATLPCSSSPAAARLPAWLSESRRPRA